LFGVKQDSQAVQRHAGTQRHDAVPAVAAPVGLVAEADAAEVAFGQGGCCCCCGEEKSDEEGSEGGRRGHCSGFGGKVVRSEIRDSLDGGGGFRSWSFLSGWVMSMSSGECRRCRVPVNGKVGSM
jgi:hypothetical protein